MNFSRIFSNSATALLLLLSATDIWALSPQAVFSASSHSVAALEALDDTGKTVGIYSATQVGRQKFVSLCDALDTSQTIRITVQTTVLSAKVTARDRERNLCLLEVSGAPGTAIALQPQPPVVGSRVYAVSNALGMGIGISEGVVSGIRHFPTGDYIQFTAPISPGSEGGALVDAQGQLVGILDYRHRSGQNVNFAAFSVWVDAIDSRSVAAAAELQRFDTAQSLSEQKNWPELAMLAAEWLRLQPDNPDALRFTATAAHERKDADTELSARKALFRANPSQLATGMGLGEVLLAQGRIPEALEHARQLTSAQPEYAQAHWLLARAQQANGDLRDAEASYQHAINLDVWLLAAYVGLAELAQKRGDAATAISIWSRLTGLYPHTLSPRLGLVQAYLAAGQPALAYSTLSKIPHQDQDSAIAWYWRGAVLAGLGCPEAAVQSYQKSLDRQPDNPGWVWVGMGSAMASLQRVPEAISAFESALLADPTKDAWRYQLAVYLKDGGRAAEALVVTTALTQRHPEVALYWRVHGFTLGVLDRDPEAITAMEQALQLDPQQPRVWSELVAALQRTAQGKRARETYAKLRSIDTAMADKTYRTVFLPFEERSP